MEKVETEIIHALCAMTLKACKFFKGKNKLALLYLKKGNNSNYFIFIQRTYIVHTFNN